MKLKLTALALAGFLSVNSFANEVAQNNQEQDKNWNVGIGTYALTVDADVDGYGEDDYSGFTLSTAYAFSDDIGLRVQYYDMEHDDLSSLEVSGFDANVFYGTGLLNEGFKAYIGGGFYTESHEIESFDEDVSGMQISGGLGYNWEKVSLELALNIRSTGDYEDFVEDAGGDTGDVTAVSSSLIFSFRF